MTAPHEIHQKSSAIPVEQVSMEPGASSHRESALLYNQRNAAAQNQLNNAHGGGKTRGKRGRGRRGTRSRKNYIGGVHTVPSFTTPGPQVASNSMSSTGASVQGNSTLLQSNADAKCDVCAGNSDANICNTPECNSQVGGKISSKKNHKRTGSRNKIGGNCSWGCMSGGKKKTKRSKKAMVTKKVKRSKKSRKGSRTRRH